MYYSKEEILNLIKKPKHKGLKFEGKRFSETLNECDEIITSISKLENKKIVNCWEGEGCIITLSSAEFISRMVNGKNLEESIKKINKLIFYIEKNDKVVEEFKVFDFLKKHPSRKKCFLISANSILNSLKNLKEV